MSQQPRTKKPEKDILAEIMLEFGARPDMRVRRETNGTFITMDGRRTVSIGRKGRPDLMIDWVRDLQIKKVNTNNPFYHHEEIKPKKISFNLAVETKTKEGKLSPDQKKWRDNFIGFASNNIYVVARSVQDVYDAIQEVENRW